MNNKQAIEYGATHIDDNGDYWKQSDGEWLALSVSNSSSTDYSYSWIKDDSSSPNRRPIQKEMTLLQILAESDFEWPSDDKANYVAQDEDGDVWWFEKKPAHNGFRGVWHNGGRCDYIDTYTKASDRLERVVSMDDYIAACFKINSATMRNDFCNMMKSSLSASDSISVNIKSPDPYKVDASEDDSSSVVDIKYNHYPDLTSNRCKSVVVDVSNASDSSTDLDPNYTSLKDVLDRAYNDASKGKGKDRHAQELPFDKQPMQQISKLLGSCDGLLYQAVKKVQESKRLPTTERQVAELLGAINYIAGAVIYIEGQDETKS